MVVAGCADHQLLTFHVDLTFDIGRPEHMYNFRVRALNSVGFSDWSPVSPPFFTVRKVERHSVNFGVLMCLFEMN